MAYNHSGLDEKNIKWMANDNSVQTLHKIIMKSGELRGLSEFSIEFNYPITVIAGENGSGKSTLLAIASCAFHNNKDGYKLPHQNNPYYTFRDFFVQSSAETQQQEAITINYAIRNDRWYKREPGLAMQTRKKNAGGRWNDYDLRVKRNVVYFGIQRVVPYFERSAVKAYRQRFQDRGLPYEIEEHIKGIVGRIFQKDYSEFKIYQHSKYYLPIVKCGDIHYSGFNMGAGEGSVFEILLAIYEAGRGALFVIDEIELGLHEAAQRRFIKELKEICNNQHCQIICSSHSHAILDELPPEGRFFIKRSTLGKTQISSGITPQFACGEFSGGKSKELTIFVEDEVAISLLQAVIPWDIRKRITIIPIGSFSAVCRQLASCFLEDRNNCLAILDGDQRVSNKQHVTEVANNTESSNDNERTIIQNWCEERLTYLPGDTWPEKWIIDTAINVAAQDYLMSQWEISESSVISEVLSNATRSKKHREFWEIGEKIARPEQQVRDDLIQYIKKTEGDKYFSEIIETIRTKLNAL